ncbi:hypothetical protein CW304_26360 [Bacillus sp. UFRGS-B20]|nr:hypothetical protein CW304_26360 [Bacillus sp. UFRGS-B20]
MLVSIGRCRTLVLSSLLCSSHASVILVPFAALYPRHWRWSASYDLHFTWSPLTAVLQVGSS